MPSFSSTAMSNDPPPFERPGSLDTLIQGAKYLTVCGGERIYIQGDIANTVFFIQKGAVKLTLRSKNGKEAIVGILGRGDFLGEAVLSGQRFRTGSAIAITDSEISSLNKDDMIETLRRERSFSDMFVEHLLARNIRLEESLLDQLFNSSEKRLARILLLLAHFESEGAPGGAIPRLSQETLAEMIGTTRARVSFFMNRFRKSGLIQYSGGLEGELRIHDSLLNAVLHD
jgi:CRP/FNR family transcriptional regulator, cyclic AMP receptor protein